MASIAEIAEIAALVAAVGAGIVAGLCFAFATFIMRALDRLGPPQAIRAMQAINAVILRSSAMFVWFGTAIVGVVAAFLAERTTVAIVAAAAYVIGAVLITGRGNVPLNEQLDRVDADAPGAEQIWRDYFERWGRWNSIRTVMLVVATAGFAIAA